MIGAHALRTMRARFFSKRASSPAVLAAHRWRPSILLRLRQITGRRQLDSNSSCVVVRLCHVGKRCRNGRNYVRLEPDDPGLQGVGFRADPFADLERHRATVLAEGFTGYDVLSGSLGRFSRR